MNPTKSSILKKYMAAGDWRSALKLAAKFPRLGSHKVSITRANEAMNNPAMYVQMGYDTRQLYRAGIAALKTRYL